MVMFGLGKKNEIEKKLKFTLQKKNLKKNMTKELRASSFHPLLKGTEKVKHQKR